MAEWFIASVLPLGDALSRQVIWSWSFFPTSLIGGLSGHLYSSTQDLIYTLYDPFRPRSGEWVMVVREWLPRIFEILPPIFGVILLAASVVMLLGAFKIMTYPTRLQRLAPTVLGILLATMLVIQIFVPPFTTMTDWVFPLRYFPVGFKFDVIQWVSGIGEIIVALIVPIAVLLISLVPVFAPAPKVVKAKRR